MAYKTEEFRPNISRTQDLPLLCELPEKGSQGHSITLVRCFESCNLSTSQLPVTLCYLAMIRLACLIQFYCHSNCPHYVVSKCTLTSFSPVLCKWIGNCMSQKISLISVSICICHLFLFCILIILLQLPSLWNMKLIYYLNKLQCCTFFSISLSRLLSNQQALNFKTSFISNIKLM